MTEIANTPELRFPEFKDSWHIKNLKEIGTFKNGINKDKNSFGYGFPFVNLNDVFSQSNISINDLGLIDSTQKERAEYNLVKGDVLFIRSSVKPSGVGLTKVVHQSLTNTVYSGFLIRFREQSKVLDDNFKSYIFSSKTIRKQIIALSSTSANTNINQDSLKKVKIILPILKEQKKIGNFFSKLDRQIELEEEKLELLEQQKRGYMQKVFYQELRFKDKKDNYYSDWKNYQLKDLTYYKNGKGYEKVTTTNGKYNIINLNSIGVKGELKDSGKYTDFEDDTLLKNDLIMILSDVAKGNLIGMTAIIDENNKYLLNQRIALLRIKNSLITNAYFLYLYINFNRKYFINMSTGMSQLNINKKTVEDFQVNLPSIEEQNKIAILFKNYEDTIKKQASKVKLLKRRKQGLLQKMFI